MAAEQLAAQFVSKNGELSQKTKTLAPIRKECKVLMQSIMESMVQRGEDSIVLPALRVKVALQRKTRPLPIKQEYIAQKLVEILETPEERAAEIAQRIWDERPTKESPSLKFEKEGTTGGVSESGSVRKRSRKE